MVTVGIQIKKMTLKYSQLHFRVPRAITFHISDSGNVQGNIYGEFWGVVCPLLRWTTDYDTELEAKDLRRNILHTSITKFGSDAITANLISCRPVMGRSFSFNFQGLLYGAKY